MVPTRELDDDTRAAIRCLTRDRYFGSVPQVLQVWHTESNFADRTIWTGDNLDILRGLNSASVDLIYLDSPFNSNRNYAAPVGNAAAGAAVKDTWALSDLDVAWM